MDLEAIKEILIDRKIELTQKQCAVQSLFNSYKNELDRINEELEKVERELKNI